MLQSDILQELLILTNQRTYYRHNAVHQTGLSDFHLLTVTEPKNRFQKA